MSNMADEKIADLEKELNDVRQMLFVVLHSIGEPVYVNLDEARAAVQSDQAIKSWPTEDGVHYVFEIEEVSNL